MIKKGKEYFDSLLAIPNDEKIIKFKDLFGADLGIFTSLDDGLAITIHTDHIVVCETILADTMVRSEVCIEIRASIPLERISIDLVELDSDTVDYLFKDDSGVQRTLTTSHVLGNRTFWFKPGIQNNQIARFFYNESDVKITLPGEGDM